MRILLAHSTPEILQDWKDHFTEHQCLLAHDVHELVTSYVEHEPDLTFTGELTFPLEMLDTVLGNPANVFEVSGLEEIHAVLAQPWQPPPPSTFDRDTPRISMWADGWPMPAPKLRTTPVKDEDSFFALLLQGASRNHQTAMAWADAFTAYRKALLAEVTYRLPHGSWKTIAHLQTASLRLCSAISLYLPASQGACLPTPLHPRIIFICRIPPEHLQIGARVILNHDPNPVAARILAFLLRPATDFELADGLDEHAQKLLGIFVYLRATLKAHLATFDGFLKRQAPQGDWMRTARTVFEFWDLCALNRTHQAEVMAKLPHPARGSDSNFH